MQPTDAEGMTMEQTQSIITHQRKINDQFAQRIIDWYFSESTLNWETFLDAKKIALITKNPSFTSEAFQSKSNI
jgi:hypothetical protein